MNEAGGGTPSFSRVMGCIVRGRGAGVAIAACRAPQLPCSYSLAPVLLWRLAGMENNLRMVLPSGLEGEAVVEVAASRYFSAVLTAAGEVWCFGADYNGSLGSDNSWSTSAQKVCAHACVALVAPLPFQCRGQWVGSREGQ